jgi:RimJ/RimL family protein N-acetyltransferase
MTDASHVRLAPLTDEHIARYLALSADPTLVETMGWVPFEQHEKERFLQYAGNLTVPRVVSGRTIAFSIVDAGGDTPVGYLSLKGIREGGLEAEVGIAVMDSSFRGRGVGTEAMRQAMSYAFERLGLAALVLTVFPDNVAAIRSYQKVGFIKTDLLAASWTRPDGTPTDLVVMECRNPDYKQEPPAKDRHSTPQRTDRRSSQDVPDYRNAASPSTPTTIR